jgi:hypothetical protein
MGRPRKYLNPSDAKLAKREQDRKAELRRPIRTAPNPGLQFCYYQPVPPQTQINVINPRVGLAVNNDITLPEPPHEPLSSSQAQQFTPFGFHAVDYNSEDLIPLQAPIHPQFSTAPPAPGPPGPAQRQAPIHPQFGTAPPAPGPPGPAQQQAPIHPQFGAVPPAPGPPGHPQRQAPHPNAVGRRTARSRTAGSHTATSPHPSAVWHRTARSRTAGAHTATNTIRPDATRNPHQHRPSGSISR